MTELSLTYDDECTFNGEGTVNYEACNYNPEAPCYDGGCRDTSQGCHGTKD